MTTVEYITKPGDRWDLISYKAYGTIEKMGDIVRANPEISVDDVIPEGLLLQIPVIPDAIILIDKDLLPPWKR
jgi:phage tail protein X